MYVIKRNGQREEVHFGKISKRLQLLAEHHGIRDIDPQRVAQKVIETLATGVSTERLDVEAADVSITLGTFEPDYAKLAVCISISNLYKKTPETFSASVDVLHGSGTIPDAFHDDVTANKEQLNAMINTHRDFEYEYFGFKTLERTYLLRHDDAIVERPQYMLMRVAVNLWNKNLALIKETYEMLASGIYTHATPVLFNSGTIMSQLSSCFLLTMQADSIRGIYSTLGQCAEISKMAGGLGVNASIIRAKGSRIKGTNGHSNGIVPMLRVYDATARYVDQGGGKRKGSCAIYLEPWHLDIEDFLQMKKTRTKEEMSARDLFYALWVPDLFMKRVEQGGSWTLFCPHTAPGLADVHSEAFERLYQQYEQDPSILPRKTMPARTLWDKIMITQLETSGPYMMFKDACNRKSNQQNLGTIRGSNLCAEIVQYSSATEIACCNLASVNLAKCVVNGRFDFDLLQKVTKVAVRNLDRVIDITMYPLPEAELSNKKHRPLGLGVMGLADAFIMLDMPFESAEASKLNRDIFETLYFAACTASCELAMEVGAYESYEGSPMSQGKFQFDLWGVTPEKFDWSALRILIRKYGIRNSLLLALMPTASTSLIQGANECMEPFTSNIYTRGTLAGDFVMVNKHLVQRLTALGLWDKDMKEQLILHRGSVQQIEGIPAHLKALFKTAYEISPRVMLQMAADRGAYIDQTQSLNLYLAGADLNMVTSVLFRAWQLGLKTGVYYLHTKPKANPIQFTVDAHLKVKKILEGSNPVFFEEPSPKVTFGLGAPPQDGRYSKVYKQEEEAPSCSLEKGCGSCGT
jgi:ribonucleoside-diphosphate reductase alpha chain